MSRAPSTHAPKAAAAIKSPVSVVDKALDAEKKAARIADKLLSRAWQTFAAVQPESTTTKRDPSLACGAAERELVMGEH